jgi:hypothetical protein
VNHSKLTIIGCIVPVERDVEDPNAVEVDKKVKKGARLVVSLHEHPMPLDLVKLHIPLSGRNVDKPSFVL